MRSIQIFTVVVLFYRDRMLLLRRADWKSFAPARWTGVGGKVEPNELLDVEASALRELFEETDLSPNEVSPLVLRRTLTFDRPTEGLVVLLYFTGETTTSRVPACNEGALRWVSHAELGSLDTIENSGHVFDRLFDDIERRRSGVRCGFATYAPNGGLVRVVFDEE